MGKRNDAKAATQAKMIVAARECFATLGYEGSTIRDIARTAGMSTGAFFANWAGKDEAYAEVYGHPPISPEQGRELIAALRGGPVPDWAKPLLLKVAA